MLTPTFALDSINMTPNSFARAYPSSVPTCLFSAKSILFPTKIIIKSFPLIALASSIHLVTLLKLVLSSQKINNKFLLVMSKTTTATEESLI